MKSPLFRSNFLLPPIFIRSYEILFIFRLYNLILICECDLFATNQELKTPNKCRFIKIQYIYTFTRRWLIYDILYFYVMLKPPLPPSYKGTITRSMLMNRSLQPPFKI